MNGGRPEEAILRALIHVRLTEVKAEERSFVMTRRIRAEQSEKWPLSEFEEMFREQLFNL